MASNNTRALGARMVPPKSQPATDAPRRGTSPSAAAFRSASGEYAKRLTLDLTVEQHRKLKIRAVNEGTSMNDILRDFIDNLGN